MHKKILPFLKARFAPRGARQTFSQYAEDLIVFDILKKKGIKKPFYIDIGAHDPIFGNNTYLMYRAGGHGILVEPNPELCKHIQKRRSRDICLNAGVGGKDGQADFYVFPQSTRSTFSKEQADAWSKQSGQQAIIEKRQIISLNMIIKEHGNGQVPDLVSIDAEGLDLEIISHFNWNVRPKIFCVESDGSIDSLMQQHNYELVARVFQNSIFIDSRI